MDFRLGSFVPLIVLTTALLLISQALSEAPGNALRMLQIQLAIVAVVFWFYRRDIEAIVHIFRLNRAGLRQLNCGCYGAAEESFAKALDVGKNREFIKFSSWQTFNNLGLLSERRGQYTRAQQNYTDALQIGNPACLTVFLYLTLPLIVVVGIIEEFRRYGHRHTREKSLVAVVLTISFILSGFIKPFPTSMALLLFAGFAVFKGLRTRTINRINRLMTQLKIAELDISLGQYDRAVQAFRQFLETPVAGRTAFMQAISLTKLGQIHLKRSQLPEALDQLEQARAIHERQLFSQVSPCFEYGETLLAMSEAYIALGEVEQAQQHGTWALEIARKIRNAELEGRVLLFLGKLERPAQLVMALEQVEKAIAKVRETGYPALMAEMLHFKGTVFLDLDCYSTGEATLYEAIDLLQALLDSVQEDADKVALFELQTGTYALLQRALVGQGKAEAALVIAEQGRARAFLHLLYPRMYPQDSLILEILETYHD